MSDFSRALEVTLLYPIVMTVARIAMTTTTTMSSTIVKPRWKEW